MAELDWAEIDPSIIGTLFERGLDPDKRSQLGAHYTDRDKIMLLVEPTILRPLLLEWANVKTQIESVLEKAEAAIAPASRTRLKSQADGLLKAFLDRLRKFTVLDPACGSGNFLYLALHALKDVENRVSIEAEAMGLHREFPQVGPEALKGIEINPYAAELARVSIWVGEIQWMKRNGYVATRNPILTPLQNVECRDAVLNDDGTESVWPIANVIIGNPPFLGAKLMKRWLGAEYTDKLRRRFEGRLSGFSDLVCFWFEKARAAVLAGQAERTGLVGTSSLRGGTNRPVLDRISNDLTIFDAWSELPWTVEGAAVEVSLVCFAPTGSVHKSFMLDGNPVSAINPDLTSGLNLTRARALRENEGASALGIQKSGPFDIPGTLAREWLQLPANPNGRYNFEVLKPYWNGDDVTARPRDYWFIDLPLNMSEADAALFEAPFEFLSSARYDPENPDDTRTLREARSTARDRHARERWWLPYWPRPEMRRLIEAVPRYIVTTETSEHRLFVWLSYPVLPDKNLIVIARDDDTTFGVLHSRYHEQWALRLGTSLEDRPRYTSTTTFSTFPFPSGLTPDMAANSYASNSSAIRIARAAQRLNELRNNWLNPADLIRHVPEVGSGFPDRVIPVDENAAAQLKKRTLTTLYNERPSWLTEIHRELDLAVAAAYGWQDDISDDDAMERLLALNIERAT